MVTVWVNGCFDVLHKGHIELFKVGKNFIIVTPGIRLKSKIKSDDQKRVQSPKKALSLGADYLVIGRPITKSKNPLKVLKEINKSLF